MKENRDIKKTPISKENEEYNRKRQEFMDSLLPEMQERIKTWLAIGKENPWIKRAWDPPFDELSFYICTDVNDLADRILEGNHCLGSAFVIDDICFINQVTGGDEWLTIKGETAFESITMQAFREEMEEARARLIETVGKIKEATEEQCKRLEYK